MRIVGGIWRGRSFEAPEGRGTRPTTDRMRETIASMVLSECGLDLTGARVLDAFAGSGGMGLELLSRGAEHCTFCEKDGRAAALVRRNCISLGAQKSSWSVIRKDVRRLAEAEAPDGAPISILFLDPPYAIPASEVSDLIQTFATHGWLAPECLVVYERASDADELGVEGAERLRTRTHGGTSVDLLRTKG